jgi:hypothetical protein
MLPVHVSPREEGPHLATCQTSRRTSNPPSGWPHREPPASTTPLPHDDADATSFPPFPRCLPSHAHFSLSSFSLPALPFAFTFPRRSDDLLRASIREPKRRRRALGDPEEPTDVVRLAPSRSPPSSATSSLPHDVADALTSRRSNDLPRASPQDLCDAAPMSEPWCRTMDVDSDLALALAPSRSPSSSVPRGLPFLGKLVDGVHEVVFQESHQSSFASPTTLTLA